MGIATAFLRIIGIERASTRLVDIKKNAHACNRPFVYGTTGYEQ
jgi:hypothetical protein